MGAVFPVSRPTMCANRCRSPISQCQRHLMTGTRTTSECIRTLQEARLISTTYFHPELCPRYSSSVCHSRPLSPSPKSTMLWRMRRSITCSNGSVIQSVSPHFDTSFSSAPSVLRFTWNKNLRCHYVLSFRLFYVFRWPSTDSRFLLPPCSTPWPGPGSLSSKQITDTTATWQITGHEEIRVNAVNMSL